MEGVLKFPPAAGGARKGGQEGEELAALRAQIESDQRLLIQFAEEKVQLAVQVGRGRGGGANRRRTTAAPPSTPGLQPERGPGAARGTRLLPVAARAAHPALPAPAAMPQGYDLLEQHLGQADLDIVQLENEVGLGSPVAV